MIITSIYFVSRNLLKILGPALKWQQIRYPLCLYSLIILCLISRYVNLINLCRCINGEQMSIYTVGVSDGLTPFSFGSLNPPLKFVWSVSNKEVAVLKTVFHRVCIKLHLIVWNFDNLKIKYKTFFYSFTEDKIL